MSVTRLMRQRVTIEPLTGEGARGAVYGPPVVARARVQEGVDVEAVRDGSAERHEATPVATVYLPYGTDCPERSRITLPSGQVGRAVTVTRRWENRRVRHLEVKVA
ncbi:hypothetical protein [Actinomadura sp. 21ATH]|uniref:hypothetical protein n=1 Tax=Actinomadura sp. 21ATH TaxID=1735444 RepID=UPI0035C02BFE